MSFTMDSGIELMSENSTMDGSFQTDTWEYMRIRRKVFEDRRNYNRKKKIDGERISVEVELHNLKLDDLKKIEGKRERQRGGQEVRETSLKDTIYMIESPQDSSSGIASDDHNAHSSSMPGSAFSTSFMDSELSDDQGHHLPRSHTPYGVDPHSGASLSSQQGSHRLSSDPESFTQDESDTGVGGRGFMHGYNHEYPHHHNKPRSRVPLSPKITVKGQDVVTANRTSHSQQQVCSSQSAAITQRQLQANSTYHISEAPHQHNQNAQISEYWEQQQQQQRTRSQTPQEFMHNHRNSYVNVHLNNGYHSDQGYSTQNGYSPDGVYSQDSHGGYPAYPYRGYSLEETEKLIHQAKKKNKLSYFDLLPDDVMIRILGNLPSEDTCRCARVSRRWYSLVWDPALWTTIRLNKPDLEVDRALKQLTKRLSYDTPTVCVMVERINLNGCEMLTDKGLNTIARRCPELRQLECQGCPNITNIAMFEVVSRCVNMEHLNVAGCPCINCICLTPEATVQATAFGKQIFLRYLDMTDCYALDDAGLQIIASYCSQLVHLYLRRCTRVTDIGVQYVANYCTQLREFSISDCKRVTDFGMRELSKLEGNLRYLSVAKCDQISDVGIKYIARYCHKLRYLNVRGCEGVSDDSIEMVARNCKRLKSLDVGKCDITDDGLQVIAQHCPQLRKLSLKSCDAITDVGIIAIANHCPQLQQLNIQDCQISVDAYRIVKKSCKRCIIEHTNPGFY